MARPLPGTTIKFKAPKRTKSAPTKKRNRTPRKKTGR